MSAFSKRSLRSLICVILIFIVQYASAQERKIAAQVEVVLWQYGGHGQGYGPDQLAYPHAACLLQNGNILIGETWNNRVIQIKSSDYPDFTASSVVWNYSGIGYVYDVEELSNGNILIASHINEPGIGLGYAAGYYVVEITPNKNIVWQYGTPGVSGIGPNQLSRPTDIDKLPNGNYLITDAGYGKRVIEVDQAGNIVWEYNQLTTPVDADYLSNGNYLITDRDLGGDVNDRIIEVRPNKTIVRKWRNVGGIPLKDPMDADILDNGHMMICDRNNNRVVEIAPDNPANILWEYPTPLFSPYGAERLRNGYTLVTDANNHRVIIVGPQPQKEVDKSEALSREILTYTLNYTNIGTTNAHNVTIKDKIPEKTTFVVGSVTPDGGSVQYSNNGGLSWNYTPSGTIDPQVTHLRITYSTISPAGTKSPTFQVKINSDVVLGKQITNSSLVTTDEIDIVVPSNEVMTTITGSMSQLRFTDAQYQDEDIYPYNDTIYLELKDEDRARFGILTVTVTDSVTGDNETLTVTETTTPGVFRGSLPNSLTQGGNDNDGILKVHRGDPISAGYTDPQDANDVATDTAAISSATPSSLRFVDAQNQDVTVYPYNDTIYLELTDEDKAGAGSLNVTVTDSITGDSETITLTKTITPGVFRGSLPNSLTQGGNDNDGTLKVNRGDPITAGYTDPQDANDVSTDNATISSAASDLTSSSKESSLGDANNDGYGSPGEVISYTITIRNTGTAPTKDVVVTDPIPEYTTYISGSISGRGASMAGLPDSLRWQLGAVAAGELVVLGFRVRINDSLPPGATEISNYARVCEDDTCDTIPPPPPVPLGEPDLSLSSKDSSLADANLDGYGNPGEVISYTITIRNIGTAPAKNVVVTDPIPAYTAYLSGSITGTGGSEAQLPGNLRWQIGTVSAGATVVLGFRVRINDPLPPGATEISNYARIKEDDNPDTPISPPPPVPLGKPDLSLSSKDSSLADANLDGYGNPGEVISYTITIRNIGTAPAKNVVVTDPIPAYTAYLSGSITGTGGSEAQLPGNLRWQIGTVSAGATVVLGFRVRINNPLPPGATEISNYARVKEDDNPNTPISPPPPVPLGEPDLSHSLKNVSWEDTNNDGQINPGELLSYTITIHNKGNVVAENVVVIDTIPDYTTYLPGSITGTGWSEADLPNSLLRWQIGTIVAGDTVTLGFRVRISDSLPASVTRISNQGIVTGTNIPDEPTDDPRTPQPNDPTIEPPAWADLSSTFKTVFLEETDNDGFAEPGEVLAYTITIQNTGNGAANNVVVADAIPQYTSYLPGSITGTGGSEAGLPNSLRWQAGTISAGTTIVLGFKVRINDPLPAAVSEISNQGIVTGSNIPDETTDDPNTPEPDDPTKKVVIKHPDLSGTTKTASLADDLNGNRLVDPGETLLYTITVKNTGGGEATGVVVTDTVPEYTGYVARSIAGPGADDSNVSVMIWRIGTVAPNSERILTFNVRIADPFPEGISGVRNKAVVTSNDTRPITPNISVDINKPDLSDTTKVVSNPGPMPGDIVTYTIVVRNTGNGTATETVFRDPIPRQTEYIPGTLKLKGNLLTDASDFDAGDYNQTYPGGIFVRIGDLPPGGRAEISFDVRVGAHLAKDVIISNQGEVDSKETDPELTDSDGEDKNGDQSTDLRVGGGPNFSTTTKTVKDLDQDQEINPGDILEYEIIVRNTGNDMATKVVVTDPLPAQVTYAGKGSGLGPHEIQGSTLIWRFDEFGINAEILTFQVKIKDEVETGILISNQGLVTSKETVPELTDADGRDENGDQPTDVVVSGLPDLSVTIKEVRDVNGGLILPGDVLEYTIRIPNDGVADAVNVVFQDVTPLLTTYMPGSATLNGNPVPDLPGSVSPLSTGLYIGLIPAGGQAVVTFRVQSDQGLAKGTPISNQGMITGKDIEELTDDDGDSTNGDNPTVVHIDGVVGLGVISGRVFIDYDGDKVEDPEDVGLPGTVVTAIDPAREVKVEKTDQDGNFTINYLEPTIYQVEFVKDGVLVGKTSGIVIKPNELIWVILPVPYDGHLLVTKQTDKNEVMVGEYLTYTVRVKNHNYIEVGPINIEDQIPPGFKYLKGTTYLNDSLTDDPDVSGNGRNLNFNLGMLPAQSTTAISYQLVVGAGVVVPGEYKNAAWIKDETGEFTSDTASVVVEVVPDPTFNQSNIIGRVFCDNDGDGKWGPDDMGLEGVKVAIDNGWVFAITDVTGKYHLKGIHPGTRVIKVDKATLPPGSGFITEESRFVDLTPGLPARVNFGIQCGRVEVIDVPMRLNIEQKTEPEPVIVTGNVKTMQAEINGREVGFPLADIRLKPEFEDKVMIKGSDLTERPIFRLQASGVEDIKKWSIIITDPGGETFWSVHGEGDIPSEILWDGKNEDGVLVIPGEVYSYQLRLEESDGDMAISPIRDLAVGIDMLISIILRGALFDTDKSFLRPEAKENLTEVAKVLRKYPDEPVVIEGHCDWRASDEYNLALSDRRANSVKNYLVEVQGIPEERLTPIGYGESRPVATNSTEEGMQLNRRVEIKSSGQEKVEAPVIPPREHTPEVSLNRIAVPFYEEYDFSHTCLPHQIKENKIELDMIGLDGKRSVVTKDIPSIKIAFSAKREMILTGEKLSLIRDRIIVILKGVTEPDNQVFINEKQVEVSPDGIFEHSLALGIGITAYRIVAKNPAGYTRAVTETISILASGDVYYATDRPRLTVLLPPEEVEVYQERLPIKGEASPPGTLVRINGRAITTTPGGSFSTEIKLKKGINPLLIEVIGKDGSVEKLERVVRVDTDYIFLTAIADGLIGQIKTSGDIDPLSPDDKYDGDLYAEGRLAYYLKGKVKGKYLVTSSLDTDRKDEKRLLTNLDPDKYYPIYGDSSNSVYDSDVRKQFYLRVDRDESYLLFGNYATGLSETELAGYNRTLYGGKFKFQSVSNTRYGNPVTKVILFGAEAHQRSAHNEIAANGGSIYHLNYPNIVEGSEQVRLEVRDKDTGRVLAKEGLERNVGYTVKYDEGRIYLKQPVPSVVDSDTLIEQHILPGHLVWIVIDYEYEVDDFQKGTAGGRIRQQLGDHIDLGATYVNEDRDKENYELTGFDLALKAGEKTALSAEWGESKQEDTENYISDDGGLSFNKVTIRGAKGQAIKVGFQAEVAEWFEERGDWLRLGAYYKKLEAGFSANGSIQEQGSEKISGEIITHLNDRNTITLKHTLTKLLDAAGTISLGNLRGKEEQISSLNIEHRLDSLDLAAAYQHTAVKDPHDTEQEKIASLAAKVGWQISDRLKASLKYQHTLEGKENHQTTAGLLAKLSEKLTARLQGTVGSQGSSALVGLAAKLSEQVTANLMHTISGQKQTTMMETTNKLSKSSEVYARYQLTSAVSGKTNQALLGLNNRWKLAEGVMANLNYERSEINVNNGDDSSKNAVSAGLEYLASDKGKASTKWELILDENSGRKRRHFRTLNAANMKLSDDLSAMGKINYGRTENRTTNVDEAQFRELSAGLAYRPLKHDRINLLAKYTNLLNLRPGSGYKKESNIAAAEGAFDLSQRFQLVEKIAVRWRGEERNGRDLGSTRTELLINRLNFHVTSKWDADVEYRILRQKEADERRDGFLLEVNRMIGGSLRAGVGYNFTDFSDNLYSDNNYTTQGWFLRLQGKY